MMLNIFTYDLHDSGLAPSIEVLVESIATPILLLSFPEHLPTKLNIGKYVI